MARQKIIAVRDREVDAFNRPIFVNSIGQATRMFRDEINRVSIQGNDNIMYQHPDDFDLYELGEWDEEPESSSCLKCLAISPSERT